MIQKREIDLTIEHVKKYVPKPPIAPPPMPSIQQTPVQEKEAYLICQRTGHEYHITRAQYSIGAGKNVDILTPDNIYVGRKHATLYKDGSRYYLVDENSKNGTRVNGEKLYPNEKFLLGESVRIEFADEVYRFELR